MMNSVPSHIPCKNGSKVSSYSLMQPVARMTDKNANYSYILQVQTFNKSFTCSLKPEPTANQPQTNWMATSLHTKNINQLSDNGSLFHNCRHLIHTYKSHPIKCKEYLTVDVAINGVKTISADFLVVPSTAPTLLRKTTAQCLGILKLGISHVS